MQRKTKKRNKPTRIDHNVCKFLVRDGCEVAIVITVRVSDANVDIFASTDVRDKRMEPAFDKLALIWGKQLYEVLFDANKKAMEAKTNDAE